MKFRSPATLLGAGGVAWMLGQALLPDMGLQTPERYDAVAGARGLEAWSAGLLVVGGCLLVLGAIALSRALVDVRGRGSRLTSIGAAMTALGGVWLVAGRAAFNMLFLRVTDESVPREVAIAILDDGGGPEFVPLVLTLVCLLVGPVLVALGLRRAGLAGWLPLALWVLGIAVFLASEFTFKAGEVAGIGIAALALGLIGRSSSRDHRATATTSGPGTFAPNSVS